MYLKGVIGTQYLEYATYTPEQQSLIFPGGFPSEKNVNLNLR